MRSAKDVNRMREQIRAALRAWTPPIAEDANQTSERLYGALTALEWTLRAREPSVRLETWSRERPREDQP